MLAELCCNLYYFRANFVYSIVLRKLIRKTSNNFSYLPLPLGCFFFNPFLTIIPIFFPWKHFEPLVFRGYKVRTLTWYQVAQWEDITISKTNSLVTVKQSPSILVHHLWIGICPIDEGSPIYTYAKFSEKLTFFTSW